MVVVKNPPANVEDIRDLMDKGMATHSSIPAWRISWTEEPSRLQSILLQRVRHNWSDWINTGEFLNVLLLIQIVECCETVGKKMIFLCVILLKNFKTLWQVDKARCKVICIVCYSIKMIFIHLFAWIHRSYFRKILKQLVPLYSLNW